MAGKLFSNAVINFTINTQNALQQLTGFQQKFAAGMGQMKTLLAGFIGFQGLRGAYNGLTKLVDVADKWNMPVEKVSRFANVFTEFGGSAEEAYETLDRFQNMANQLKFHSSGPLRELSAVLRANFANKDYQGAINTLRSQWGLLASDAQAEVLNMLGMDSAALRRMLSASNAEMQEAIKNAERFSVITEDQAASVREMRKSFAEMKQTLTQAMIPVLEALQPLVNLLRDIAMAWNDLDDGLKKSITTGILSAIVLTRVTKLIGALTSMGGILGGIATGGALAAIIAFGPGLMDFASKMNEVAKGTKTLAEAMDELAAREDAFGRVMKKFERLGEIVGNLWTKLGSMWSQVKITLGFGDAGDAAKVLADQRKLYEAGAISPEEFNATQQKMQSIMTANIPRIPKNQGFIPYANPDQARLTFKGMPANVTQNINIYGVANAEDAVGQFRTIAEQTLTPLMGPQG